MISRRLLVSGLVLGAFLVPAWGQTTRPAAARPRRQEDKVLPLVKFAAVPLDNVVDLLRELDENFQAVVVRPKEVPAEYPTVPPMAVKSTTASMVAELLGQVLRDSVRYEGVPGKGGRKILHIFRVTPPREMMFDTRRRALRKAEEQEPKVSILRLSEVIDANLPKDGPAKDAAARRKVALNRVLSLVQAALNQVGGDVRPVIVVHEETETLILKGTSDHAKLVASALKALRPSVSRQVAKLKRENMALQEEMQLRERELRNGLLKLQAALTARGAEVQKLEVALAKARRRAETRRPSPKEAP